MIKKTKIKFADGSTKTQIRVVKGVRPGPKEKTKQITVKSFGYLEDQTNLDLFWKEVNDVNESILDKSRKFIVIESNINEKNNCIDNQTFNYSYAFFEPVMKILGIKDFFDQIEHSLYDIFEFLIFQQMLNPCSKRMHGFYNKNYDFKLDDLDKALDIFANHSIKLQYMINDRIKKVIGRKNDHAFYHLTNFYYEKDLESDIKSCLKYDGSKEKDSIVQFGMLLDSNHLPITMKPFPANSSDSIGLISVLKELKSVSNTERIIVVSDKGNLSSDNIDYLISSGDGYLLSATIRDKKGYQNLIFDDKEWVGNDELKYKEYNTEIESKINSKKKSKVPQKVFVFYSKADDDYQKAIINLKNNLYDKSKDFELEEHFIPNPFEVNDAKIKSINYDKVKETEKLDGYYCIVTSEMNYAMDQALETYRNFSHSEESFKIENSGLTNNQLEAHLLIYYTALLILRLIQLKMGADKISISRMQSVFRKCECKKINSLTIGLEPVIGKCESKQNNSQKGILYNTLELNYEEDEIRNDYLKLLKSFKLDLDLRFIDMQKFNNILRKIKFEVKKV